ncbi:MAG: hypothetical protein MJ220_02545 [Bacilli bacterium]|nr:hypothetical protein [Bacilli bacterium]
MKKKSLLVLAASAAMLLVACGGAKEDSKPASNGGNNTPTSSKVTPASSSTSKSSVAPRPSMTVATIDLEENAGKAYIVITGTAKNYAAGEFKWAWGLEHVTEVDGGEGFAYGSETPADADYKEVVTVDAEGKYAAKLCISDLADLASGLYKVYAGAKGFYAAIDSAEMAGTRIKDSKFAYNYRSDEQTDSVVSIAVDALPPIALQEASVFAEGDQTWVRIGGESNITLAEAETYTPFVQFQNVNNWRNSKMAKEKIRWNFATSGKAYIEVNVTGVFAVGGNYNTHLNIKEDKQQDCKMDAAISEHYDINGLDIEVFSDPTTTAAGKDGFWGNLGFRVTEGTKYGPVDNETLISKADAYNRAAIRATSKIATGEYKITTINPYMEEPETSVGSYEFDDDMVHLHQQNYSIFVDTYVYYDETGLVAYEIAEGDPARPTNAREDMLSGPDFSFSAGFNPQSTDLFGAEVYLNNAFAYAKENVNGDLSGETIKDGYKLSFLNIYDGGWGFVEYKKVTIEATFDSASNILKTLRVEVSTYGDDAIEGDEVKVVKDDAVAQETKILEVTQATGERKVEPPFVVSQFYILGFTLKDENNTRLESGATYTAELGEWGDVELYYDEVIPETASLSFDPIKVTCDDPAFQYGNARNGTVTMNFSAAGTYEVTIASKNISYTITVVATAPTASSMDVWEMAWSWGYFSPTYELPTTTRVGNELCFRADVQPGTADQSYTVSVAGDPSRYTLTTKTYEDWSGTTAYTSMVCKEEGEYTITVTSVANPELSTTFTVTAEAALDMNSIITGKYSFGWDTKGYATFTPNAETDALDGTVVIERGGKSATYNYVAVEGETKLALSYVSGEQDLNNPVISWDNNGALTISETISYDWGDYDESYEMSKVGEDSNPGEGGGIGIYSL